MIGCLLLIVMPTSIPPHGVARALYVALSTTVHGEVYYSITQSTYQ